MANIRELQIGYKLFKPPRFWRESLCALQTFLDHPSGEACPDERRKLLLAIIKSLDPAPLITDHASICQALSDVLEATTPLTKSKKATLWKPISARDSLEASCTSLVNITIKPVEVGTAYKLTVKAPKKNLVDLLWIRNYQSLIERDPKRLLSIFSEGLQVPLKLRDHDLYLEFDPHTPLINLYTPFQPPSSGFHSTLKMLGTLPVEARPEHTQEWTLFGRMISA